MNYKIKKVRGQPIYRVINTITNELHYEEPSLAKAKAQMQMLHQDAEGGSLSGIVKDVIIGEAKRYSPIEQLKYYQSLVFGRNDFSPKVVKILDKYGNLPIKSVVINRTPVSKVLTNTMNWISGGDFYKNLNKTPYDTLFHLRLDIQTTKGTVALEKNEVINMDENPKTVKQAEIKRIDRLPSGMTLVKMLEEAKKLMGNKFFPYSASSNNCQDFVNAILKSNKIGNQQDYDFVKQNTEILFRTNPFLKSIADKVTGLGSRVDVLLQGGEIKSSQEMLDKMAKLRAMRGKNKKDI